MKQIRDYSDERNKAWCIYCHEWIGSVETNRDHVPTKALLVKPYPENLPTVEVCTACNQSFSDSEEYLIGFLGAVVSGSTDPEEQVHSSASRALAGNARLRREIEGARTHYETRGGETKTLWQPDTKRVEEVIVKNARGHAYFEYGEPISEKPDVIGITPLELLSEEDRASFEDVDQGGVWPEVGSRMLTRAVEGHDLKNGWVVVQNDVYRYSVIQFGKMTVRSVIFDYLATEVVWN